jgi:hypothetical protein
MVSVEADTTADETETMARIMAMIMLVAVEETEQIMVKTTAGIWREVAETEARTTEETTQEAEIMAKICAEIWAFNTVTELHKAEMFAIMTA